MKKGITVIVIIIIILIIIPFVIEMYQSTGSIVSTITNIIRNSFKFIGSRVAIILVIFGILGIISLFSKKG